MQKRVLQETLEPTRFVILESRDSEKGSRTSALGVVQRCETVNGNQRVYPRSFFERILQPSSRFMQRVQERSVCGHIEHPSDGLPDLRKFAVVMTDIGFYEDMVERYPSALELNIESPETAIVGRFEALSTPDGKIVEALWHDRIPVGSSSRAQGSVVKNEGRAYPSYPDGVDVVQDDVCEESLTWDMVARPSTPGAFSTRVREAIQEAIEDYQRESLQEAFQVSPPIGKGIGGSTKMSSLRAIRERLSRVKPHIGDLANMPRRKLIAAMREVDSLVEALDETRSTLTESQELSAADMRGELQAIRDQIMAHVDAAFQEAEGKIPGASAMQVAKNTTSNFAALNADPALDYPSSQNMLPGGQAGAGAVQEPDKGSSDQSVPGAGVDPKGDVKLDPEQSEEERRKQAHGTMVGDPKGGTNKGVSGQSVGKKGATEAITTDQAHKTQKGTLDQPVVKQDEEGEELEVDDYGRSFPDPKLKAGKGKEMQGIVASQSSKGDGHTIEEEDTMTQEALATLNRDLVRECRALRQENRHWRQKYERASQLMIETGKQFRHQRFRMAMERLIENNPVLDSSQTRKVLETARDEKHMIQMAEAILGTRARITQEKERELTLKVESDGFYRLYIDGKPHERIFDGNTMFEALRNMGIPENEIVKAFDDAHGLTESRYYKVPDEQADMVGDDEQYQAMMMIPMEPADDEVEGEGAVDDFGDEGGELLDLDFGDEEADPENPEDEGGPGYDDEEGDVPGEQAGVELDIEAEKEDDEDDLGEACKYHDKEKKNKKKKMGGRKAKTSYERYAESRRLNKSPRKPLNESRRRRTPVAGSRRLREGLPSNGSRPSRTPPAINRSQKASAEMSLTERVIARQTAEKRRIEEARRVTQR